MKFAQVHGNVSVQGRLTIFRHFNSPDNAQGQLINVLLLSPASFEGVNMKCVKYVHILSPQWTYSHLRQIIYRAVRKNSHVALPPDQRFVQPFLYISYDENLKMDASQLKNTLTTD